MLKVLKNRIISFALVTATLAGSAATPFMTLPVYADSAEGNGDVQKNSTGNTDGEGKYISDVFIAYGKTEKDAVSWLTGHGWEPIKGNRDFNAGKKSGDNKAVAAVMGIKRTDNAEDAVTDMAVMNMNSGYSFDHYEDLVDEKKEEINAFISTFLPTIEEYRANYYGDGSEAGQMRAELAYELLNRFRDGGPEEKYAANDTGKLLGDLFLEHLMQEGGGEGSGDLEQIILESSGPAVTAIESILALAADTGEDTWVDRLQYLTGDELIDNAGSYIPEADGQDIAPSAIMQYYKLQYGDAEDLIAGQWSEIHDMMVWYEQFIAERDLLQHEDESDEAYAERYNTFLEALEEDKDSEENAGIIQKYRECLNLYLGLYTVSYPGEWGETLGDFFNPTGDDSFSQDSDNYLPMAVALSEGQKSSLAFLPLDSLLMIGFLNKEGVEDLFTGFDVLPGEDEVISVYSGINRGVFRQGVALTSEALRQIAEGEAPDVFIEEKGMNSALFACLLVTGLVTLAIGSAIFGSRIILLARGALSTEKAALRSSKDALRSFYDNVEQDKINGLSVKEWRQSLSANQTNYDNAKNSLKLKSGMIIGAALMAIVLCITLTTIITNYKMLEDSRKGLSH